MRAMQGSFPRLKDNMHYEENVERRVTLHLVCFLHNFKTKRVGMNQIANSFMLHFSSESEFFSDEHYLNMIDGIADEDNDENDI